MIKVNFSILENKIITKINGDVGSKSLYFFTKDGQIFKLEHEQDCCENVYVQDIIGNLEDLIGSPIQMAEESSSDKDPKDYKEDTTFRDSFTWTFYKLATLKGYVTIRFLGESNGYYSESVTCFQLKNSSTNLELNKGE